MIEYCTRVSFLLLGKGTASGGVNGGAMEGFSIF